jgi:Ca-activated chloride channel family protein
VEAAELAATLGIKIYTIGAVGSQVAQRSRRGFMMGGRASVDEPTLQKIATVTGGRYFRATDTDSLVEIYDEIDQLERRRTGERVFQDNVWAAKIAMMSGLGLLMFELLLVNTRYRRIP